MYTVSRYLCEGFLGVIENKFQLMEKVKAINRQKVDTDKLLVLLVLRR